MAAGRKLKVPGPTGALIDGVEIMVRESTERWSEFTLEDGTVVLAKQALTSCVRLDNQFDEEGKPIYVGRGAPIITIKSVPDALLKKSK
jgi:hypothetical protein